MKCYDMIISVSVTVGRKHIKVQQPLRALILVRESEACADNEMQNQTFCTAFQPREKHSLASLIFFCFLPILLGPAVPKLPSLMHDLIGRHCGGFWPQPTTPSIKYGTVAFKAMLNVPDTWERGREGERRACSLCRWGEERRGTLWDCWGECFKFQIITLRLGIITADLCLTDAYVCTSVFRFTLGKKKCFHVKRYTSSIPSLHFTIIHCCNGKIAAQSGNSQGQKR